MKFTADFHIHSHYSLATSKQLVPEHLDFQARIKGITVIGTGDFTHPGWVKELKEKLEPAGDGLFRLKDQYRKDPALQTPYLPPQDVRFILTAEISNIYKKNGRVRKIHNVIFAPDFETVDKIQSKLTAIEANITSDGRPILGMDARDLLELALDCSEDIFFVPAHIWTPWFSALGSKSGFDTIEECYDDLSSHIHAVETGLSTDPPMHWMCSFLDKYTLVSNSDAHSPEKLGRNATLFNTSLSYDAITHALKTGDPNHFSGTIDLFPQEGKYHYDGHRKCGIRWDPVQTLKHDSICAVCGKPVTVGVMNRVVQLSDREDLMERKKRAPFYSIIPLKEILSEIAGVGPNSKKVGNQYTELIKCGTPELDLLLHSPLEYIEKNGGPKLAEAIRRMRNREVDVKEGYDGEYGIITVFEKKEAHAYDGQSLLFSDITYQDTPKRERRKLLNFDLSEYRFLQTQQAQVKPDNPQGEISDKSTSTRKKKSKAGSPKPIDQLNPDQLAAVKHFTGPALVIAGPGTGKTKVLTSRIVHLIREQKINPANILAVTFTNKAATEIDERLKQMLPKESPGSFPTVTTFHSLGYSILKALPTLTCLSDTGIPTESSIDNPECSSGRHTEHFSQTHNAFTIIDADDKKRILRDKLLIDKKQVNRISEAITMSKQQIKTPDQIESEDTDLADVFQRYQVYLEERNLLDLEDLIYLPVLYFDTYPDVCLHFRDQFQWMMVDEYQDVNYGQYRFIRQLFPTDENTNQCNLCVIGDPDQAIYGFRGANVQFIRDFEDDYPQTSLYRLKKSYRCSDRILQASGHVIGRNDSQSASLKGIDPGIKINIVKNTTDKSEAEYVARTIESMMGGLRFFSMDSSITQGNQEAEIESLSDFVVLCRVKTQMEALQKAFNDHSIPYQVIGDVPFFRQEPVKSVIDFLKLSQNPANIFLRETLTEMRNIDSKGLDTFIENTGQCPTVTAILSLIIDDFFHEEKMQLEMLFKELFQLAEPYEVKGSDGKEAFLKFAALGIGVDTHRPDMENVSLMTLHAAKGLEFKCVFIVGCEEDLLPYSLFKERESDVAEERRLLYVGMTRTRRFLYLSHADKRFMGGREYCLQRSSFLDSIEQELLEFSRQHHTKKEKPEAVQRSLFD